MAHYAKIKNGVVTQVIVAEADFFETFVDDTPGKWLQTSYNTKGGVHYQADGVTPSSDQTKAFRKNYPHIGWTYDSVNDAFVSPKPFSSWVLNTTTGEWEAPVDYPSTVSSTDDPPINIHVSWDETNLRWVGVDTRDPIGNWRWDATNTVWVAL